VNHLVMVAEHATNPELARIHAAGLLPSEGPASCTDHLEQRLEALQKVRGGLLRVGADQIALSLT